MTFQISSVTDAVGFDCIVRTLYVLSPIGHISIGTLKFSETSDYGK